MASNGHKPVPVQHQDHGHHDERSQPPDNKRSARYRKTSLKLRRRAMAIIKTRIGTATSPFKTPLKYSACIKLMPKSANPKERKSKTRQPNQGDGEREPRSLLSLGAQSLAPAEGTGQGVDAGPQPWPEQRASPWPRDPQ